MSGQRDTIVAIATPPGAGGIGIVRLSGPASLDIARCVTGADGIVPRYARYAVFRDAGGGLIDRGILLYFESPHSYTGEDVVEFQAHGGRVVLNLLQQAALDAGARPARAGEFTERAYLNGRIDLIQAEAVADLIHSGSIQAARSAARSLEGEFSSRILHLLDELVSIRVLVEGSLDFPEEEIEFIKHTALAERLAAVTGDLDRLLAGARRGSRIREGLRAAIVGRPNVGKSSLLNALTRNDRAIVTAIAGTTRDVIEDVLELDGLPINLIDTAGIRDPADEVEREGVNRSLAEVAKADLIILVTDRPDDAGLPELPWKKDESAARRIIIHNKIDLHDTAPGAREKPDGLHLYLSARTGEGLDLLAAELKTHAGADSAGEDVVLARARHIRALMDARSSLEAGSRLMQQGGGPELLAEELLAAQKALGRITGEFHTEDLLGEIFSRFCIGK